MYKLVCLLNKQKIWNISKLIVRRQYLTNVYMLTMWKKPIIQIRFDKCSLKNAHCTRSKFIFRKISLESIVSISKNLSVYLGANKNPGGKRVAHFRNSVKHSKDANKIRTKKNGKYVSFVVFKFKKQ